MGKFAFVLKNNKDEDILVQSTIVISKLKGPYETFRDTRTSTY